MVAYSFKAIFEAQIATGIKTQTIRAPRKRHAHPGEALQLYCGMRTRHCRKILTPDPVCMAVRHVVIVTSHLVDDWIASVAIGGMILDFDQIEAFAVADGFAPNRLNGICSDMIGKTARANMGAFWRANHPEGRFDGVLIDWGSV